MGFSDAADRPPSASAPGSDLRRGRRRHRRARGRRRRPEAARARVGVSGALHHAPAADRGAAPTRTSRSRSASRRAARGRRVTTARRRRRGSTRSRGCSAGKRSPTALRRPRVRCWPIAAQPQRRPAGESERAKAKVAKAKGRKGESQGDVARKYLIETFGCQMNVHDSERMAGLLEQAGFEADRRGGRRRRRRHQHVQRARARRGEAVHAARRAAAAGGRAGARSDRRRRRLRRAAGRRGDPQARRPASPTSSSARRRSAGCRCWSTQAARDGAARARVIDLNPYDDVTFPLGRDAAQRSGEGVRHDHRGLQRVLQLLRRAVHARARADAAEGRHPGRSARGGRQRATAKCSCSARSSTTTRRPTIRRATSPGCSRRCTTSTGIERIRFASPHPRHVSPRFLDAMARLPKVCRHLHLPVQSGSTRVLEAMRRRYTRESYLELVARIRERCRTWRCRPI